MLDGIKPTVFSPPRKDSHPTEIKWKPPLSGQLKLNTDASVTKEGVVGIGFVIRDNEGQPLLAGARKLHGSCSVMKAEAHSMIWGLQQACQQNLGSLLVESDNSTLVDLAKGMRS